MDQHDPRVQFENLKVCCTLKLIHFFKHVTILTATFFARPELKIHALRILNITAQCPFRLVQSQSHLCEQ